MPATSSPLRRAAAPLMLALWLGPSLAAPAQAETSVPGTALAETPRGGPASAPAAPAAPAEAAVALPDRLTLLINQLRLQNGLPPLQRLAALDDIAGAHSQWMAQGRQLSHQGFQQRFERAQAALCVENLGAGSAGRPERYISAWLASPSHRVNLMEPRTGHVGVAEVGGYITVFACDMGAGRRHEPGR